MKGIGGVDWETRAYKDGKRDSTFQDTSDRASFLAVLRMPSWDTPLRRQDFYEFDDYLRGFYEGKVEKLNSQIKQLELSNRHLWENLNEYKDTKSRPRTTKARTKSNSGRARRT